MAHLKHKRILLGVTGGIAAYKTPELVRQLRQAGAQVRVVLTRAGAQFVAPLALEAVSGHRVYRRLFAGAGDRSAGGMEHIELARWADAVLIAPATANVLAALAHGQAGDLLTTLCLATEAPIAVAPAMNRQMWANIATQANIDVLRRRGVAVFGPACGEQACGETGEGRLLEPDALVAATAGLFPAGALQGCRVLITAGSTWEAWDPARGLTNRSSGKMGYALAEAALEAGAEVILVAGPTALPAPERVTTVRVVSAADMAQAVEEHVEGTDIFIAAAAVADYRPAEPHAQKFKKGAERVTLSLIKNPDILKHVAAKRLARFSVGFAAETEELERHARAKLLEKGADMIAANRIDIAGQGFDADQNELVLIDRNGATALPLLPKRALARKLIQHIAQAYAAKNSSPSARPARRR